MFNALFLEKVQRCFALAMLLFLISCVRGYSDNLPGRGLNFGRPSSPYLPWTGTTFYRGTYENPRICQDEKVHAEVVDCHLLYKRMSGLKSLTKEDVTSHSQIQC